MFRNTKIRIDVKGFRKTEEGFLVIPTRYSRVGIQDYGNTKEYRPPEEVFDEDSLESFRGKPVTFLHPGEDVRPENAKKLNVGTILTFEKEDDQYTHGEIVIHDKSVIDYVLDRKEKKEDVQMSCGYSAELEKKEGEYEGEKYDAIQRKIRGNHVAIVPRGRAGKNVAMKLDRRDNNKRGKKMKIRLDAIPGTNIGSVEINTDNNDDVSAAIKMRDEAARKEFERVSAEREELKKKSDELEAKKDSAEEEIEKVKKEIAAYSDPNSDTVKKLVADALSLKEIAEAAGVKMDGLDRKAAKIAVIKKAFEKTDGIEARSDEYINARYDSAAEIMLKKKKKDSVGDLRDEIPEIEDTREDEEIERFDNYDYAKLYKGGE